MSHRAMIAGVGLIGGSIGMALREQGWHVSGVDEDEKRLAEAEKLANLIVDTPPLAARSGVRLSRNQWIIPAINADLYLQPLNLHGTEDFQEATKSFIEKRPPNYQAK